jgi:hypothetical protein
MENMYQNTATILGKGALFVALPNFNRPLTKRISDF